LYPIVYQDLKLREKTVFFILQKSRYKSYTP